MVASAKKRKMRNAGVAKKWGGFSEVQKVFGHAKDLFKLAPPTSCFNTYLVEFSAKYVTRAFIAHF